MEQSDPWWISLVTTLVTTLIGLFSRWFEKKFLSKRVTDAVEKEVRRRGIPLPKSDIAKIVDSSLHLFHKNGKEV